MPALFSKKRSTFNKCWDAMGNAKAHLIVREPNMGQLPLHRYMQALVLDAIPVVLGEANLSNLFTTQLFKTYSEYRHTKKEPD